ncbi:MAG TPA: hypothetical protein ENO31_02555 [Thermoprotei archaeon]|nr:hypothetical protein [TACK group archaeon]HEV51400.1 hypothetical protein [Thermoprotei archaeon]
MPTQPRSKLVARVGALVALSVMADLFPMPRVFFGMKLDLVGTVWVSGFLLFGFETATYTSLGTFLLMTAYGPTGFVGAAMKFAATYPMILMPWLITRKVPKKLLVTPSSRGALLYGFASGIAIAVRVVLTFVLNYYWAIPTFMGLPTQEVIQRFFAGSFLSFFAFVAGLNVAQGVLDAALPWILVVRSGLVRVLGYGR